MKDCVKSHAKGKAVHKIGVSGSTILSDPEQFKELFWNDIEHIEIGDFPGEEAFYYFLEYKNRIESKISFGIHSPLIRGCSKYDLLEKVQYEPEHAWEQLEVEAGKCVETGAQYLLVHFPYFKGEISDDPHYRIECGLKRLRSIQDKYCIPIICEPKLGFGRSAAGINYMNEFPVDIWQRYGLGICIDIGDYIIASEEKVLCLIAKWEGFIKAVHLHNVSYKEDKYIWTPVHLSQEYDGTGYKIEKIITQLSQYKDITFIFEHTPHMCPGSEFVQEGYKWVRKLVGR